MPAKIFFFPETRRLIRANADMFDFLWTAAAGLWSMRWQVDGFVRAMDAYDDATVKARFVSGSRIHGANIKGVCIDASWNANQEQLAAIALTLGISNFEGWLSDVVAQADEPGTASPSGLVGRRMKLASDIMKPKSFKSAVGKLLGTGSELGRTCFGPPLARRWKRELEKLDALLRVLRHFKDLRNKIVHNGGVADQQLVDSFNDISSLTKDDLGTPEFPSLNPVTLGSRVSLSLRGVVAMTDVLLRIAAAVDATLSESQSVDRIVFERWQAAHGKRVMLSNDQKKRNARIEKLVVAAGCSPVDGAAFLAEWLRGRDLVVF
ncbi:MAG: hypothetical protein KF729_06075 [Sandaracinaceae bacterium]|nr:hypothetical protein [Sandaracinaceae bacterium]